MLKIVRLTWRFIIIIIIVVVVCHLVYSALYHLLSEFNLID